MAKKAKKKAGKASKKKASAKKSRPDGKSAAVYFIKHKTQIASEVAQADIDRIHQYIKKAGGTCSLFGNKAKDADEFVSIIRALTPAHQKEMVAVIEQSGNVEALMMHILKG